MDGFDENRDTVAGVGVGPITAHDFEGTERYRIVRQLGEGGMGVVYEAEDGERGERVALKTFKDRDPDRLLRLKNEFRALSEISHVNVVELYDLVVDADRTFFTMELIKGTDFVTYVRGAGGRVLPPTFTGRVTADPDEEESEDRAMVGPDEQRLRQCLVQLAEGVHALHRTGMLHRDIKPSNVMVTEGERVVLLDFGLVKDVDRGQDDTVSGQILGTPAYMSPEQIQADGPLTPATDWYSLGTVLYEALTGQAPFNGPPLMILMDKQAETPLPPRERVADVPEDLEALCMELLEVEPEARPDGAEVLRRLGVQVQPAVEVRRRDSVSRATAFTGREEELKQLHECYRDVMRGRSVAVLLRGPSGIGKSALVREFAGQLRREAHDPVVFEGRCYERENIPYRAFDGLVDDISRYWRRLPRDEAMALLPRDAHYLPRLFPVLERVPVVAEAPRISRVDDAVELRNRAFEAFREFLQRLGDRGDLVLALDDMQWVDADTVSLLVEALRTPDPPRVMLLLTVRAETDLTVTGMFAAAHGPNPLMRLIDELREQLVAIDLEPLSLQDSVTLAQKLLGPQSERLAEHVARESAGSPFFLGELVRYLQVEQDARITDIRLEDALQLRIGALPDEVREVLELVALAGEPVTLAVLASATGREVARLERETRVLRGASFLRRSGGREGEALEPYHDRIRQAAVASMPTAVRTRRHRDLALAIGEHTGDHERLARHWRAARDDERTAHHAEQAARVARDKLEFERASELYQLALDRGQFEPMEGRMLHARLGDALANAGRLREAAAAFDRAAERSEGMERLEFQRRSAEQLLAGGFTAEGMEAIRQLLGQVGMRMPESPWRSMLQMLWDELVLRLRGVSFVARKVEDLPPLERTRIDLCYSLAAGLILVDFLRGAVFTKRGLRLALAAGEPFRVARFLTAEAILQSISGFPRRANVLLEAGRAAAEAHGSDLARFYPVFFTALFEYNSRFALRDALTRFDEAEQVWRAAGRGRGWELDACAFFGAFTLRWLGDLPELARRFAAYRRIAEQTGNRFLSVSLRAGLGILLLRRDDPAAAMRQVEEAVASWTPVTADGIDFQTMLAWTSRCEILLYQGELARARAEVDGMWPRLRRSPMLRHDLGRLEAQLVRGRVSLALAGGARASGEQAEARQQLKIVAKIARKMMKSRLPVGAPLATVLLASAAELEGREAEAVQGYRTGIKSLRKLGVALYQHAAMRRMGVLLGDETGRKTVEQAESWMALQGIRSPAKLTSALIPGKPTP